MRLHPSPSFRRPGFTLIEVLVAAGLCMLIMAVLAEAFGAGVSTFSLLKSTGELDGRLKTAKSVMQADLLLPHLEADTGEPVKVSQLRLDHVPLVPTDPWPSANRWDRPQPKGFFRIKQENASFPEGVDPDNIPSTRANDHILQMAVRLSGTRSDRAISTAVPNAAWTSNDTTGLTPNTAYPQPTDFGIRLRNECFSQYSGAASGTNVVFSGGWAEVSYFTKPSGTTTGGSPALQLHSLHRRVRVLTKNDAAVTQLNWAQNPPNPTFQQQAPGISCSRSGSKSLNGPRDITNPFNRLGGMFATRATLGANANIDDIAPAADAAGLLPTGEDIVLSNVISFEVKASWDDRTGGTTVTNEFPFADLPQVTNNTTLANQRIFDTWSTLPNWDSTSAPVGAGAIDPRVPLPIRLKAVQIKLRLYDPKNKLTRQMTFVQDL